MIKVNQPLIKLEPFPYIHKVHLLPSFDRNNREIIVLLKPSIIYVMGFMVGIKRTRSIGRVDKWHHLSCCFQQKLVMSDTAAITFNFKDYWEPFQIMMRLFPVNLNCIHFMRYLIKLMTSSFINWMHDNRTERPNEIIICMPYLNSN